MPESENIARFVRHDILVVNYSVIVLDNKLVISGESIVSYSWLS